MKAFFVLCATLSVIQAYEYQDYTPHNYIPDRRTPLPQYDIPRQPLEASRRLEPEDLYDRDGSLSRSLPRTRSNMRENQYPQMPSRFDQYGKSQDYMEQQPYSKIRGPPIGDIVKAPSELLGNVGSMLANKFFNIHKIANHGLSKITDVGNRLTEGVMNAMDTGTRLVDTPMRLMKGNTRGLTNFPSFNNKQLYQDELENRRRLEAEYMQDNIRPNPLEFNNPYNQQGQGPNYEPYAQLPNTLPQRRLPMRQPELNFDPASYQNIPSHPAPLPQRGLPMRQPELNYDPAPYQNIPSQPAPLPQRGLPMRQPELNYDPAPYQNIPSQPAPLPQRGLPMRQPELNYDHAPYQNIPSQPAPLPQRGLPMRQPELNYDPATNQNRPSLPAPLPQTGLPMRQPELNYDPVPNQKIPSQPTSEQLAENAKKVVAPITPAQNGQNLTPAQTPAVDQTPKTVQ